MTAPRQTCETTFPRALIQQLLVTTSPEWICEAIARHEDPTYVQDEVRSQLLAYLPRSAYVGRLLDFGCGDGASTMAVAQFFPELEVIGVELDAARIRDAEAILGYRRLSNARFLRSPSGDSLPASIGQFDFVMLSAVFEHLLPHERLTVMPLLWSHLRPGGIVFVNQTPHRWLPYEHHSTSLWGINYLPACAARPIAARYGRGTRGLTWNEMLRGGIRGATERSIVRALTRNRPHEAEVLQPHEQGLRGRADYWLSRTSPRWREVKVMVAAAFQVTDRLFGTVPALNVSVAIRKRA